MSYPLPPENMRKPLIGHLLEKHNTEYIQNGVHAAYSALIGLILRSSVDYPEEDKAIASQYAQAEFAELPLLARIATNPDDGPRAFRITLGRVDPVTLNDLVPSRFNLAIVRGKHKYSDVAETFTQEQIEVVAQHAMAVIQVDGLIGRQLPTNPTLF